MISILSLSRNGKKESFDFDFAQKSLPSKTKKES